MIAMFWPNIRDSPTRHLCSGLQITYQSVPASKIAHRPVEHTDPSRAVKSPLFNLRSTPLAAPLKNLIIAPTAKVSTNSWNKPMGIRSRPPTQAIRILGSPPRLFLTLLPGFPDPKNGVKIPQHHNGIIGWGPATETQNVVGVFQTVRHSGRRRWPLKWQPTMFLYSSSKTGPSSALHQPHAEDVSGPWPPIKS